ncbi:alpha/beta hydrolase [Flavobacterium sp. UMI-01]|uniref:alpha/beta hydrolase n=1 Tax=Flavobacterium sp. UMI-01 TaxID=1441053 RepID=UPI001C7D10A0|nr:alpha/beta hydrolase [Flavobacterium sp. UMI-01]GIZ10148.1 endo-1,4-beta-xylanase [Flavobacterium sp. UMI-01]
MKALFSSLFLVVTFSFVAQDKVVTLYLQKVPNSKTAVDYKETAETAEDKSVRIKKVSNPELLVFCPKKVTPNGVAVLICPGGGYRLLSMTNEGYTVAEKLNEKGITAFVLKYRLPDDEIMIDKKIGPLQDAQQAMKWIRENATKYHLDENKVGIMGFSAGGHLASTVGTHLDQIEIENATKTNLRPDFMVLVYPVISFGKYQHKGSKQNLLGEKPSEAVVAQYSNELQITKETPITFLVHAADDKAVPFQNSVDFYMKLHQEGIRSEMHLYQAGGHGFGLNNKTIKDSWFDSMLHWLETNQLLK